MNQIAAEKHIIKSAKKSLAFYDDIDRDDRRHCTSENNYKWMNSNLTCSKISV